MTVSVWVWGEHAIEFKIPGFKWRQLAPVQISSSRIASFTGIEPKHSEVCPKPICRALSCVRIQGREIVRGQASTSLGEENPFTFLSTRVIRRSRSYAATSNFPRTSTRNVTAPRNYNRHSMCELVFHDARNVSKCSSKSS